MANFEAQPNSAEVPKMENPELGREKELRDRKRKWATLRKAVLWGSTLASAWQGYEFWQPKVDALRAEMGSRVEFSLASKSVEGLKTDCSIEKQPNGSYIFEGFTNGGPEKHRWEKEGRKMEKVSDAGDKFVFVLPESTDVKELIERMKTAREPGEVLRDVFDTSSEGKFMHLEDTPKGTRTEYALEFTPGTEDHPAHAVQTSFENGTKRVMNIALNEAEDNIVEK